MWGTVETWFDAFLKLFDPYRQTVEGLWSLAVSAQIGTLLFGSLLLLLSLELLRASKGWLSYVWRVASIGAAAFVVAAILYGNFLEGPARAAYSLIAERAGAVPPNAAAWTTMGVASVSVLAYVGRKATLRVRAGEEPRWWTRRFASSYGTSRLSATFDMSDINRALSLDPAGRLQLRLFAYNAKKDVSSVKPRRGMTRRA